jgi:hypothetical protein
VFSTVALSWLSVELVVGSLRDWLRSSVLVFPRLGVASESCGIPYVGYFKILDMLDVIVTHDTGVVGSKHFSTNSLLPGAVAWAVVGPGAEGRTGRLHASTEA